MQKSPHPQPVKAGLEKVGVYGTRWALGCLFAGIVWLLATEGKVPPLPHPPAVDGALPLQQWTTDLSPRVLAAVLPGTLPGPDPRQKKPPCVTKLGEEAINGWCWLRLDVRPPCPQDPDAYAFEHGGKCYGRALRAEKVPTTGEPRPSNVAGGQ